MDETVQITGFVGMAAVVCVPATWMFSQGLVRLHRRSVIRHMRTQADRAAVEDGAGEIARSARRDAGELGAIERQMRVGAWNLAAKYAAAGQFLSRASEPRRRPHAQPRILRADLTTREGANEFRHALAAALVEGAPQTVPVASVRSGTSTHSLGEQL